MKFVITDSCSKGGDNGEYFYEYVMNKHPEVDLKFVISEKSIDYRRLKAKGFNVVDINSDKLSDFMRDADFIFYSKFQKPVNKFAKIYNDKCVFMCHGVSNKMNNNSEYLGKTINDNFKYVCCVSEQEKSVLVKDFNMKSPDVIITGLARWDSLIRKNNKHKKNAKPHILITFHWRRGELTDCKDKFIKSDYLKNINEFLKSEELKKMSKKCQITFMYHAMYSKYKDFFDVPEYINYGTKLDFQDLLVDADAIVTDFSSNAYEMAVIGKPCFYYIPDMDYVKKNMEQYDIDNFNEYSIGKYCKTQKELIETLKQFIDGKYEMSELNKKNIEKAFSFIDQGNCERIFNFVKSIKK